MSPPAPLARSVAARGPTDEPQARARRWRRVGLAGSVATAVAATAIGALPTTDALGDWPRLIGAPGHPWPEVVLAYLGVTLLCGAWWQLGRVSRTLPDRMSFLVRTALLWALPLAIAPPLYSRDVYSYLAQGALYASGLDPYKLGPAALGGPLASNVSAIWQTTPAPYGPIFLWVARGVTSLAGNNIVLAVLLIRAVMIASLAATAACLIPLARRFGVDPASAVWLGVANPLVFAEVVSGAHNDALMVVLMMAGVLLAVRDRPVWGSVLVGLAVLVKLPAAAALVVIVPSMARQLYGRHRLLRGAAIVGATSLGTALAVTLSMGTGFGWVSALSSTVRVRNGLSLTTDLGQAFSNVAWVFGIGDGAPTAVDVLRQLGIVASVVLSVVVLTRTRGKPLYALGLIMLAVVLLGPVMHPWYLLWGVVPLAASCRDTALLDRVAWVSIGLVLYPMPWGEGFSGEVVWGLIGIGLGLVVLWAVPRPAPSFAGPSSAQQLASLQLQAR